MGLTPEVVLTGLRFPEGPVWCADGTVVCTTLADGRLWRVFPQENRAECVAVTGGSPNAAAPANDGSFVVTQSGGYDYTKLGIWHDLPPFAAVDAGLLHVRTDGTVAYLTRAVFGAPNDLVTSADGTIYFTDPPCQPPVHPTGRVHAYSTDGTTRVIAENFAFCNGIALERDGSIVVVEKNAGLMRVHLDGTKEWIVEQIGEHGADGFCLDEDGNFYVAGRQDHGIWIIDPAGAVVDFLPIPAPESGPASTTNCCFGGADRRTLFVTDGFPGQLVAFSSMPIPGRAIHDWAPPTAADAAAV